jgi:hypothetical protein
MSTPDQPETPQLTRRQLRELRNTASTPIITPEDAARAAAEAAAAGEAGPPPAPVAPLPRAAEPVELAPAPVADGDPSSPALTRRAVRQQERLRTASVPVIDEGAASEERAAEASEDAASDEAREAEAVEAPIDEAEAVEAPIDEAEAVDVEPVEAEVVDVEPVEAEVVEAENGEAEVIEAENAVEAEEPAEVEQPVGAEVVTPEPVEAHDAEVEPVGTVEAGDADERVQSEPEPLEAQEPAEAQERVEAAEATEGEEDGQSEEAPRHVVATGYGAELLAGDGAEVSLPASFDQILARGIATTGSISAPNALILSQTPETGSLVAPINATGEVLVTGTFSLPESFGSTGTVPGSADGKDADAVLLDGELPASSSPTPIAASAAISTIKSAEDIIKPPAPEKGGRLMLLLTITAGVLAAALAGVLILAFVTGVFS